MPRPTLMRKASAAVPTAKALAICALTLLCVVTAGCRKRRRNEARQIPLETVDVILDLQRAVATKAGALPEPDEVIKDMNIYLFHRAVDTMRRHYFVTVENPLNIEPLMIKNVFVGDYDVYVLANNGRSTCDNHDDADRKKKCPLHSTADMANLYCAVIEPDDVMTPDGKPLKGVLMTYKGELNIRRADRDNPLEAAFDFTRAMTAAKVTYTRTSDAPKITGVVVRTPKTIRPFNLNAPETNPDKFGTYKVAPWETIYIFSNIQGRSLTEITDIKNRNAYYAPQNATCFIFNGTYSIDGADGMISYNVYPRTSDSEATDVLSRFDILPNTPYDLKVNFKKPDLNDPRLSLLQYKTGGDDRFHSPNGPPTQYRFKTNTFIQLEVEIVANNLFNSTLSIYCSSSPADQAPALSGIFEVDILDDDGNVAQTITSTTNILSANLAVLTNEAKITRKLIVKYKQTLPSAPEVDQNLLVNVISTNGIKSLHQYDTYEFYTP